MESTAARPLERTYSILQTVLRRGRSFGQWSRCRQAKHDWVYSGRTEEMDRVQDLGAGRDVGGRWTKVLPNNGPDARRRYVYPRTYLFILLMTWVHWLTMRRTNFTTLTLLSPLHTNSTGFLISYDFWNFSYDFWRFFWKESSSFCEWLLTRRHLTFLCLFLTQILFFDSNRFFCSIENFVNIDIFLHSTP